MAKGLCGKEFDATLPTVERDGLQSFRRRLETFVALATEGRFFPGKNFFRGLSVCVRTPEFGKPEGRTADPSTTLRSGRDDNFVWER